jgi:hypothetical protein
MCNPFSSLICENLACSTFVAFRPERTPDVNSTRGVLMYKLAVRDESPNRVLEFAPHVGVEEAAIYRIWSMRNLRYRVSGTPSSIG